MWTSATQLPEGWVDPGRTRMSTCELEADVAADDVLNRRDVCTTTLQAAASSDRLVQSLKPLWDDEVARAAAAGAPPPELRPYSQRPNVARPQSELQKSAREVLRRVRMLPPLISPSPCLTPPPWTQGMCSRRALAGGGGGSTPGGPAACGAAHRCRSPSCATRRPQCWREGHPSGVPLL